MDALVNMKFEVGKFNPSLCKHASTDIRLFYHGDDFVTLAGENDLRWFVKELNEALIVKVRGVLGGGNHSVEQYRAIRTDHEWLAILGVRGRIRGTWKSLRKRSV